MDKKKLEQDYQNWVSGTAAPISVKENGVSPNGKKILNSE